MPVEFAQHLFECVLDRGRSFGLRLAGLFCQDALRMEKGFKHWGHDIGPDDTPLEAGLGFAVAWDKPDGFIGREALIERRRAGPRRRLLVFTLPDRPPGAPLLLHEEPILRDGAPVGTTTSGAFAYTLDCPIALGYVGREGAPVDRDWLLRGRYEIGFAATPSLAAPYDPKGERMRA